MPVIAATAVSRDEPIILRGLGTVTAYNSVALKSRIEGAITAINFKEGQEVHAGDVLIQLDARPYQAVLDEAKATLAKDQASLANAQLDLKRYSNLLKQNFTPEQQVATQQATVAQDQAVGQSDQAAITAAQLNVDYAAIKSPIDGITGIRQVDLGNLIQANSAQTLVTVTQIKPIYVIFTLPETEIDRIRKAMTGGKLTVYAYAQNDRTRIAQGVLDLINNGVDAATGTVQLKAEFPNADEALWPGQFVNAHLVLQMIHNAVNVPTAAVQTGPKGSYAYVVTPESTVERRPIRISQTENNMALVASGLKVGERVVTAGPIPASAGLEGHGVDGAGRGCRVTGGGRRGWDVGWRSTGPRGCTMSISAVFIRRPIATCLLMTALLVGGIVGYNLLPVAALPSVDFPTIVVSASLPGADPETMASSVAQPLERQFADLPGVNQITSTSVLGSTAITLQFDLSRNIDGAAGDVQSAINAAQGYLPKNLPNPPTYKKVNPSDSPVLILGLTSDAMPLTDLDQYADLDIAQRISTLSGVGQVVIFGEQKFAPTIMVNPLALAARGIGLDDVATAITSNTANLPVGSLQGPQQSYQIGANGQIFSPKQIARSVVVYRNGAPVRVGDIAKVVAGSESPFQASWVNAKRGEMIGIWRQPGANTIELVDQIKAELPKLQAGIPPSVKLSVISDRSVSIRESFTDVKITLMGTILLVVIVIFVFLRNFWATLIPTMTVPLSLVGTFAVMYMLGYSLDNLSLMALTLAVGLVVDDAIVMLENIFRHLEEGKDRITAALEGSAEIGFTIVSITVSLIAVFIPLLFMGGIVGRLFREFGVTVTVAVVISALIALTLSPMMASLVLKNPHSERHGRFYAASERVFERIVAGYERGLKMSLRHRRLIMLLNVVLIAISGWLFVVMPKGFFPQEDTGLMFGFTQADQDISFAGMAARQEASLKVVRADPDVEAVGSSIGGSSSSGINTGRMFIQLKPFSERSATADQIIARLRPKLAAIPGVVTYLQSVQNIRIGGRISRTQYEYTLQDTNLGELNTWAPKILDKIKHLPQLRDVASDQQTGSPQLTIDINRDAAARLNVNVTSIEQTLYDAFGQPFITQLYAPLNTYHVLLEVAPRFQQDLSALSRLYVHSGTGQLIPISQFATLKSVPGVISVNHQGQFPSVTLSFNLAPDASLGQAVQAIQKAESEINKPPTLQTSFQGTASEFQKSLSTQPLLIAAALFAVYVVLGVLYESFIHPFTILLSLPSASVGALVFLKIFGFDISMMAIIGLIMLIGIVKKNAIMMIDFALVRERTGGMSPEESIYEAAVLRFRPIMMTTMAALLGTLPIALGIGAGADLRQPLGVAVVGGLIVSQALTLFTTPITYLYMDEFNTFITRRWRRRRHPQKPAETPAQTRKVA